MPTRRQVIAGGVTGAIISIAGCTSVLDHSGASSSDDDGTDGIDESPTDTEDGESPKDDPRTKSISTEIEVDRPSRPRLGDSVAVEFVVTNEGEQSASYDYRLRLEHEDGLLGGDEPVSGTLPAGKRRLYDLEFLPPRAGTVALLLEKETVDEFDVRSRRSDDDNGADDDDSDESDNSDDSDDGDTAVTTGGEATVVGEEAAPA